MWKKTLLLFLFVPAAALIILPVAAWWLNAGGTSGDSQLDYSVEISSTDGETLRLYTTSDGYWRLPAHIDDLDPRFLRMLLAYEDKRFYSHFGVDPLALARAAGQALLNARFVSGASTLSMQTVRLQRPRPRTLANKLREIGGALALEWHLSKQEILELYLSLAPYGGNLQGVRAASRFYFGKEPRFLSHAEAALLVALPQSPERRRPDRYPAAAREARDAVLERMQKAGLMTAKEAEDAGSQRLPGQRIPAPRLSPHLADRLRAANPGRQLIHTSVDASLQRRLESLARRHQVRQEQGVTLAMLVLDNHSGEVRAYLGSGDYLSRRFPGQVDMVRALRSPGSTLKPFIYGMGFDAGFLHPETLINDRPGAVAGYAPGNFDHRYAGEISVREALQASRNVPAVRVLERLGAERFVRRLQQAGVELRLPEGVQRPGLPVALGGVGISLEQLSGLYASLARARERVDEMGGKGLLSPAAVWYLTDILRATPLPPGFIRQAHDVAFKTGTSYGFRDAWAVGYDMDHTVGVWIGRPDGGYTTGLSGLHAAAPLLLEVFDQLPDAGLAPLLRHRPKGVLVADNTGLPHALKRFSSVSSIPSPGDTSGPRIIYPLDDSVVELPYDAAGEILIDVRGGTRPLHWMLDGRYMGSQDSATPFAWHPQREGELRLSVMDGRGSAHSIRFRLLRAEAPALGGAMVGGGIGE